MRLRVGYQHSRFLSILTCFVHYYSRFWGPKAISMLVEPQGALTCRPSTTVVLVDSGPFQGLLLNPRVRLRVGHRYSRFLSCLTRFVDYYSPFWGPKAISMVVEPQGVLMCRSSTLTILANSGPFRGLLLTILARFGVPERFSRLTIPMVCLHVRRQYS